jgi:hypothetical protein
VIEPRERGVFWIAVDIRTPHKLPHIISDEEVHLYHELLYGPIRCLDETVVEASECVRLHFSLLHLVNEPFHR